MSKLLLSNIRHVIGLPYKVLANLDCITYQERLGYQNAWELALNKIDVALVPSNDYANYGCYYGNGYGVTCKNSSQRVILYANQPINSLHTIYFYEDNGSSAILLRLLLSELWKLSPKLVRTWHRMVVQELQQGEGLLILHDTLVELDSVSTLVKEDLVSVWQNWTGLPYVFHVWAFPENFSAIKEMEKITSAMNVCKEICLAKSRQEREKIPMPEEYLYFYDLNSNFSMHLTDQDIEGVNCFFELCASKNILPMAKYKLFETSRRKRVKPRSGNEIFQDVLGGKRISVSDGITLARQANTADIGLIADLLKRGLYSENKIQNVSLIDLSISDIDKQIEKISTDSVLIKGLKPGCSEIKFYTEIVKKIKSLHAVHVEGFPVSTILELTDFNRSPIHIIIKQLADAGLDAMSGSNSEVKFDGTGDFLQMIEEWLRFMRWSHRYLRGSSSSIPVLRNDHWEEWFLYLLQIRRLQDFTHGISYFYIDMPTSEEVSAENYIKQVALARIFLDNLSSQGLVASGERAYLSELSLEFGANFLVNLV